MRLAFCLFKYFPYGGLQRDFLRIARVCLARGHTVDVYTMKWEGKFEPGLAVHIVPAKGFQNHTRRQDFVEKLETHLKWGQYDMVVGFNKIPGLDIYYAADTCYQAKARHQHGILYRLTSRFRRTVEFEKAVFSPQSATEILLLSTMQQDDFIHYYRTQPNRFHLLPPGIDRARIALPDADKIRAEIRRIHGLDENDFLLLMVGSGFKTKGLDRALLAFAALPADVKNRTQLFVIGKDNAKSFQRQAKALKIHHHIHFLGGREEVPRYFAAADLLVHPAYNENTGTVLLEALVAGLPVLTTSVCGYAHYIEEANAGTVLPAPFRQQQFNKILLDMLLSKEHGQWRQNALNFARNADIYSMPERAATIIESLR